VTGAATIGAALRPMPRAGFGERAAEAMTAAALAGPAFVLLFALVLLPCAAVLVISLTDWQLGARTLSFVGLDNFLELSGDPVFRRSFRNTLVFAGTVVPATLGLGLLAALLIEAGNSARALYRAVHFLPFMATLAAMTVVWEALLHPTIGLVNQTLQALGLPTANWLRDEDTVLGALAVISVWQNLGLAMVLFLAGLKAISQDLYDAADIDGADEPIDRATTVTLPMLGPVGLFVLVIVALRVIATFDTVRILTEGGPAHASELLLHTLYVESFDFLRTGYGAAMAVVFLAIVTALTLLQARLLDRRMHYQ
jgi:multiple sugar transport system permease protein